MNVARQIVDLLDQMTKIAVNGTSAFYSASRWQCLISPPSATLTGIPLSV